MKFEDSWGMGDDCVRFKMRLPCLCKSGKAEFVNCKFLYPDETHKSHITVYECLHCRTVISLTVEFLNNEMRITSKTKMAKNKDKPISSRVDSEARDFYRTHITRKIMEKLIGGITDDEEDEDDPKNWKPGWVF